MITIITLLGGMVVDKCVECIVSRILKKDILMNIIDRIRYYGREE